LYKELKLIRGFVALEKERYEGRMEVVINIDESIDHTVEMAPLLLIPFVENAFKHGVKESIETIPIAINFTLEGKYLVFIVRNKIPEEVTVIDDRKHGLGLKNLERRLKLLYQDKHDLETKPDGDYFQAKLKLQIYE